MHIVLLTLILAAIIITINAIHRGYKSKQKIKDEEEESFKRLLEKRRELNEMDKRLQAHEERLKAIKLRWPTDNDDPEATIGKNVDRGSRG